MYACMHAERKGMSVSWDVIAIYNYGLQDYYMYMPFLHIVYYYNHILHVELNNHDDL